MQPFVKLNSRHVELGNRS